MAVGQVVQREEMNAGLEFLCVRESRGTEQG